MSRQKLFLMLVGDFVEDYYCGVSTKWIAKQLKRTPSSIRNKASRLYKTKYYLYLVNKKGPVIFRNYKLKKR